VDDTPPVELTDRVVFVHKDRSRPYHRFGFVVSDAHAIFVGETISGEKGFSATPISLVSGQSGPVLQLPPDSRPLAVSPDGLVLAARSEGIVQGEKGRLDLWSAAEEGAKHLTSFDPFIDESRPADRDILSVWFVANNRLLIRNDQGRMMLWEFDLQTPAVRAIWNLKTNQWDSYTLSPGCRYLYIGTRRGVLALEVASGEPVGHLPSNDQLKRMSVSPDGRYLAGLTSQQLQVWDLQTGQLKWEYEWRTPLDELVFVEPEFVLASEKLVYLPKGVVVWEYQRPPYAKAIRSRVLVEDNLASRPAVRLLSLPHRKARLAASEAAEPPRAVMRGSTVSLDIQISATAEEIREVTEHFRRQLEAAGINIADGQPVRLVVRTERRDSERRTVQYRTLRGEETVTMTPHYTFVHWMKGDATLWTWGRVTGLAGDLYLKDGQSAQQVVNERAKFDINGLKRLEIPTDVVDSTQLPTPGRSMLTLNGIIDR